MAAVETASEGHAPSSHSPCPPVTLPFLRAYAEVVRTLRELLLLIPHFTGAGPRIRDLRFEDRLTAAEQDRQYCAQALTCK